MRKEIGYTLCVMRLKKLLFYRVEYQAIIRLIRSFVRSFIDWLAGWFTIKALTVPSVVLG